MTVSAELHTQLRRELDVMESNREGFLTLVQSFKDVMDYLGTDHGLFEDIEYEASEFQKTVDGDYVAIQGIKVLLKAIDDHDYDIPAATFSADDAREHDASKVDVQDATKPSGKPVQRRKVVKGTKVKATRLTLRADVSDEEIATIRKLANEGVTYTELAHKFFIGRGTVGNIVNHKGCYA